MSYVVASYAIAVGGTLVYAVAVVRARAALRKALRAERKRDGG